MYTDLKAATEHQDKISLCLISIDLLLGDREDAILTAKALMTEDAQNEARAMIERHDQRAEAG